MANDNGVNGNSGIHQEEKARRKSNRQKAAEQQYESTYEESARKPADARPNSFNLLAWMLEGATGLYEEVRHNDLGLPEEFWVHAQAARKESLLALRAIIDDLIEKNESSQRKAEEQEKRRERRGGIDINF